MTCAETLPAIVIGCDYGVAYFFALHDTNSAVPPNTNFTGWSLDADVVEQTRSGPGRVLASNVLAWANAASGVAHLTLTHAQTQGFTPGKAFVRAVLIRSDGVRIPQRTPIVLSIEHAGTTV